jgi:hypothetical protein
MSIKESRLAQLLQGQTATARKIWEVVPGEDAINCASLRAAYIKAHGTGPSLHVIEGALKDLMDAGLVRQVSTGMFMRRAVRDEAQPLDADVVPLPVAKPLPPATSLGRLEQLGARLRALADMAENLRDAALAAAEEADAIGVTVDDEVRKAGEGNEKLKQFAALLKGFQ